jgi:hypothetical protein
MSDLDLTQNEADLLIAMPKHRANEDEFHFPGVGGSIVVPLVSEDQREFFWLDISRGRINRVKATYQNRAKVIVVLMRLDLNGPPHRNPDGQEVPCPHLHKYREGYGDRFAEPMQFDQFADITDLWQTLQDFMKCCNVTRPPDIQKGVDYYDH